MSLRRIAFRVLVPLVVFFVMLVLVELLLRLPVFEGFKDYEPTLKGGPYAYLPNQSSRHRLGSDFDTVITINSRGFRDDEFAPSAAQRTAVALGDSFTEGWGVDLERSWPKQLQGGLARGGYAHVYNAGRSGTNPKNYSAVYEKFFRDDPSVGLVVVGICLTNDVIDADTPSDRASAPPSLATRLKFYALKYSVLYNIARRSLRYNPRTEKMMSRIGLTNPPSMPMDIRNAEANSRRWPYTADFIASFGAQVEASGRKFLVVLIPSKEQILDGYIETLMKYTGTGPDDVDLMGFRDHLLRTLQEKNVDVLDLTPVFDHPPAGTTAELYFRGDGHWNAAGHELAGVRIAEHLQKAAAPVPAAADTSAASN
jgi:lysophospholipase L1-like esterase